MAARESSPPASLAQLIARRAGRGASRPPSSSAAEGAPLGQTGLLFGDPEPLQPATVPPSPAIRPAEPARPAPATPPADAGPVVRSVSQLVSELRGKVENAYPDAWVEGEISNCREAGSGHLYFTLKDRDAQLPVVMFRRQAAMVRFTPKEGISVVARGRISVFEQRGQLQLIAETLQLRGSGAIQAAFEQLKAKLLAEGLFEATRKRPLPRFPRSIGVVTSPQGAVIQDIISVCRRRQPSLKILVYPVAVQGSTCASEAIAGLEYFNGSARHAVDLVLLARGGGSPEDLNGFNDEALARAIAASRLPVVSAIGHETDFTITDFAADLRAPTPSAAAELITEGQHRIGEHVHALSARLLRAQRFQIITARQRLERLSASKMLGRVREAIGRRQQRLDADAYRLESAMQQLVRSHAARLQRLSSCLDRQNVGHRIHVGRGSLLRLDARLERSGQAILAPAVGSLRTAETRLQALSPLAVLQRGYALVYSEAGTLLRNAGDAAPGQQITARLATGSVDASVTRVHQVTTGNDTQ